MHKTPTKAESTSQRWITGWCFHNAFGLTQMYWQLFFTRETEVYPQPVLWALMRGKISFTPAEKWSSTAKVNPKWIFSTFSEFFFFFVATGSELGVRFKVILLFFKPRNLITELNRVSGLINIQKTFTLSEITQWLLPSGPEKKKYLSNTWSMFLQRCLLCCTKGSG